MRMVAGPAEAVGLIVTGATVCGGMTYFVGERVGRALGSEVGWPVGLPVGTGLGYALSYPLG